MQERTNPAEYPAPAAEYIPPAEEFPPVPGPERPAGGRKKSRLIKAAAAAVMLALMIGPGERTLSGPAPVPTAIAEPTQAPRVDLTAAPTETPTETPTQAPTPAPTPTPVPEKPAAEAICMSFSDTLEGSVFFQGVQNVLSASVEIWDSGLNLPCGLTYEVSRAQIDAGRFDLPTIPMDQIYLSNRAAYDAASIWWPEPEMRVTWTYRNETGETAEETFTRESSYELGWSIRYWSPDTEASDYAAPDTFGLSTYESEEPVSIALSDEAPAQRGGITVSVTVNGVRVTADMADVYTFERDSWNYGRIWFKRDPSWPEHGTAHFTVREYLRGYDVVWTAERDLEY